MRTAAIGIGSNSLRMLLAQIDGNRLIRLERYREGLRVFAALDEQKRISGDMIAKACESVASFQKEALAQGAETVHLFATSAVRDAANQQELMQALYRATGLETDICSGDREAHLSFWGVAEQDECGMIDIGGGSTEIVVGRQRDAFAAASLQMGAVRLFRHIHRQRRSCAANSVESTSVHSWVCHLAGESSANHGAACANASFPAL